MYSRKSPVLYYFLKETNKMVMLLPFLRRLNIPQVMLWFTNNLKAKHSQSQTTNKNKITSRCSVTKSNKSQLQYHVIIINTRFRNRISNLQTPNRPYSNHQTPTNINHTKSFRIITQMVPFSFVCLDLDSILFCFVWVCKKNQKKKTREKQERRNVKEEEMREN